MGGFPGSKPCFQFSASKRGVETETQLFPNDANFNVTAVVAVVDSTTTVLERYHYTPYGEVTTYDTDWANSDTKPRIGNPYLYTGRRLDPKTGLYDYRLRPATAPAGSPCRCR